jgi:hypothetical protein
MEQIIYIALKSELHTEMHRENIAHEHADEERVPTNSNNSWKQACLIVRLQYSEPVALSLYEISPHHTFNLMQNIYVPVVASVSHNARLSGTTLYEGNVTRDTKDISVTKLAEERALATKKWSFGVDDLIAKVRDEKQAAYAAIEPAMAAMEIVRLAKVEELKIEREALLKKEAEEKAQREAEKASQQAAKKAWIDANGSERLRLGFAKGHNCEKLYTLELCDSLPEDFALDYEGDVKTKERSCPSLEALKLSEELEKANLHFVSGISIVWLPHALDDLIAEEDRYDEEPSTGIEAIELKVNGHYAYHLMA